MDINLVFKAISDPTRRKILKHLREKDMTAGEIADKFSISKPSISHHLNLLKQAELVQDERKGQYIYYSLNSTVFQDLISWFHDLLGVNQREGEKGNDR
ncbi:MAG: autorepressor SdpR family transcription factor [Bacillota bacterium]